MPDTDDLDQSGIFIETVNLKTEMEPRMDTDKHGFSRRYRYWTAHPIDESQELRKLLIISVHPCLSVVLFSFLG
jgi:hypothetical protein